MTRTLPAATMAAALLIAGPAFAHARLLSADPAPNAAVVSTGTVRLHFSERLVGRFSDAGVTATALPGRRLDGGLRVPGKASLGSDGRSLVVALAKPLPTGTYRLDYHVVSADTHRVQGGYAFRVK